MPAPSAMPFPGRRSFAELERDDAVRRGNLLVFFRFLIVLSCIGLVQLLGRTERAPANTRAIIVYLSFVVMLNALYFALTRFQSGRWWLTAQLVADCLLVQALIYLTGAVNSGFHVLYFAVIVASAILVGGQFSYIAASLATTGQALVTALYFYAQKNPSVVELPWIPQGFTDSVRSVDFIVYFLLVQAASYYLVAFLSGRLADQMREDRILQGEVLQSLTEGVLVTDAYGRVTYCNAMAGALLGLPPPEWLRLELDAVLNRVSPNLARDVMEFRESLHDLAWPAAGGRKRPLQISTMPVRGRSGQVRGVIVTVRDRTVNEELEQSKVAMAKLTALSELAAGIAHEIRNPLASIRGSAQELARAERPGGAGDRLLQIVVRESDRLNGIITDFLQFATLKKPVFHRVNASVVVDEVLELFRRRDDMRGITITRTDGGGESPWIHADSAHLRQVLLNLLINAGEALQHHDGCREITVTLRAEERFVGAAEDSDSNRYRKAPGVEIEVRDTGPGIAPEHRDKLFLPFFTTKPRGTGLGLAVAHRIVAEHHGMIIVESEPGAGAAFRAWFPEQPEAAGEKT